MAKIEVIPPIAVCDAGPLIHLDELGCLELLADFRKVLVPDVVLEEVDRHRPGILQRAGTLLEPTRLPDPPSHEMQRLFQVFLLHRGEQFALQLAQAHRGCVFLTDDAAARLAAHNLELRIHGTIGVLIRAIRTKRKTKEEVIDLLQSLPNVSTLHLRMPFLDEIIAQVRQTN